MLYRPTDYFASTITQKGKVVSSYAGTYCGYLDFDNIRYWDGRFLKAFRVLLSLLSLSITKRHLIQTSAKGKI